MKDKQKIRFDVEIRLLSCNQIITVVVYAINTDSSVEKIYDIIYKKLHGLDIEIVSVKEVKKS